MDRRTRGRIARRAARGMTLVEIMVVVVIISLVAGVVGVAVLNRLGEAQKKVAFTQLKQVSDAYASQKNISLEIKRLLAEFTHKQAVDDIARSLSDLAKRQAANIQNANDLAAEMQSRSPKTEKIPRAPARLDQPQ